MAWPWLDNVKRALGRQVIKHLLPAVANRWIDSIGDFVHDAENAIADLKAGADKKAVVLKLTDDLVRSIEQGADKDLLNNAEIREAFGALVDGLVTAYNGIHQLVAARARLDAAVTAFKKARA